MNTITGAVTREEAKVKKAAAAAKVADLNAINAKYTFAVTGEGIYTGWTGGNVEKIAGKYGAEAKKIILAELKSNGIKATARTGKGYTESFHFTITVPAEYMKSREDFITERLQEQHFGSIGTTWFYDTDGTEVYYEKLFDMEAADRERIMRATYEKEYTWAVENNAADIVNDDFVKAVKTIVSSFNSDHSNLMVDYYDVRFYADYKWRAA